jgi:hypothetical protein
MFLYSAFHNLLPTHEFDSQVTSSFHDFRTFFFTFECCILLRIYPTGFLWCRQSQQSFNMSTPPLFSLTTYCISNIENILATKKRQNNNRRKIKSLHCLQLDQHDADLLAGHKAWRTVQTIMRRYKRSLISIF